MKIKRNKYEYTHVCRTCILDSMCGKPCEKLIEYITNTFDKHTPKLRASIERSYRLGIIKTTSLPHHKYHGKTKM